MQKYSNYKKCLAPRAGSSNDLTCNGENINSFKRLIGLLMHRQ